MNTSPHVALSSPDHSLLRGARCPARRWPAAGAGLGLALTLVASAAAQIPLGQFSDYTDAAGLTTAHRPNFATNLCAGGAVADFNRDGYQDIFFGRGGQLPDQLFINDGDGTFTERAAEWGIALAHKSTGAAAGDFDGDGWIDLFVTSHGPAHMEARGHHKLYRNVGGTGFVDVAQAMGVHFTGQVPDGWGASWGDIDNDGDLDLAVIGYRPPGGNHLFRNDGSTFTDITVSSGLDATLSGSYGFTVKFVDMDGDLDQDILWVSDFGTGRYYENNGDGTFTDRTASSGTMLEDTEMGVTINDFDEDGLFDFWVTTVVENGFYINQGNHQFLELATPAGVRNSGWGWGAVSIDWNHDTRVDLIGTSFEGEHYSFLNQSPLGRSPTPQELTFSEVRHQLGTVAGVSGRGLANLDADNDGDQDVAVFAWFGDFKYFRNELQAPATHWLRVGLDRGCATTVAPDGIGSVVRARVGNRTFSRLIDAGGNYLVNSEFTAHFGLGATTVVDELRVEWLDGHVTTLHNVPADQHLTIRHPASRACFVPIGGGCASSVGVPALTPESATTAPALGTDPVLNVDGLPTTPMPVTLLVGFHQSSPAVQLGAFGMPGCALHILPQDVTPLPTTAAAGSAQWQLSIPSVPSLTDVEFYVVAALCDPQANPLGLALSNTLLGVCR